MEGHVNALVQYYAREGLWHHVLSVCNDALKRGSTSALLFWRGYALLAERANAEVCEGGHADGLPDAMAWNTAC